MHTDLGSSLFNWCLNSFAWAWFIMMMYLLISLIIKISFLCSHYKRTYNGPNLTWYFILIWPSQLWSSWGGFLDLGSFAHYIMPCTRFLKPPPPSCYTPCNSSPYELPNSVTNPVSPTPLQVLNNQWMIPFWKDCHPMDKQFLCENQKISVILIFFL